MAEIQSNTQSNRRSGVTKGKKLSTRVDLTPMVDLGFLLITFFIFTTTLQQPTVMHLALPDDKNTVDGSTVPRSKTLSLILAADNKIYSYEGDNPADAKLTDYSNNGLRTVIQQKLQQVKNKFGDAHQTIVLIKPTDGASYENIINALDEMAINDVKTYVLMDASSIEKQTALNVKNP